MFSTLDSLIDSLIGNDGEDDDNDSLHLLFYVFLCRCTLKRELPAIPLSAHPDPSAECNVERTQSQHSSDLYAAVGDVNDGKNILYC